MRRSTRRDAPPPMSMMADLRPAPASAIKSSDTAGLSSNQLTSVSGLVVYMFCQCVWRSVAFIDLPSPAGRRGADRDMLNMVIPPILDNKRASSRSLFPPAARLARGSIDTAAEARNVNRRVAGRKPVETRHGRATMIGRFGRESDPLRGEACLERGRVI